MYRTSRAFLRVTTIVGTVFGALILAMVPAFFVFGVSSTIRDMLIKAIEDGSIAVHSNHDIPAKDIVLIFQISFILTGVVLLIVGAMCVANAIIASKTRNEPTRGRYIACIVTGALSTDFSIVGGILGLIYLKRQERQKQIEE